MAVPQGTGLRVVSKGFDLRQDRIKQIGEKVPIDRIAEETGLARVTVRRFVAEKDSDVGGSPLIAAAVIAGYFGVGLGELLVVEKEETR